MFFEVFFEGFLMCQIWRSVLGLSSHFKEYGVESFDIDLEKQNVTVNENIQPKAVLQAISKTGKATSFWETSETGPKTI
ncbi:hypothetical protein ACS0TY_024682 [Phlomoides rotata]